ncbi:TetR/AcrR family transcriptional regulator [Actinomadura viridis]|uniref:AcrR family transcriptional regulator n=1 Tax=Actinomadura viridis TaxID=58110 RepID=A0A931DM34_9ACTN|nr:TetR/AcrR family transcriptional regulator [Actinomadura viridis]MBG6093719.1 AcrR family transcriptional regulator [Actinomadura viridis]
MNAATPRRRRMSRAERERQMLEVAEAVFAERGFRAASMDEIAERCGVSKPMLYEYFGSKDGLLLACVARSQAELHEVTQKAIAGATTPRDILWRGMVAYLSFVDSHSRSFTMLVDEPLSSPPETAAAIEDIRRQQSGLISGVLATFAADAPPAVVEAYTEIIIGGAERLSLWRTRRPEVPVEEAARYITDFCWSGLRPYLDEAVTGDPVTGGGEERPAPR